MNWFGGLVIEIVPSQQRIWGVMVVGVGGGGVTVLRYGQHKTTVCLTVFAKHTSVTLNEGVDSGVAVMAQLQMLDQDRTQSI